MTSEIQDFMVKKGLNYVRNLDFFSEFCLSGGEDADTTAVHSTNDAMRLQKFKVFLRFHQGLNILTALAFLFGLTVIEVGNFIQSSLSSDLPSFCLSLNLIR